MCPFSHGVFLVVVMFFCVQPLNVCSISRQSYAKEQGDPSLPYPQYARETERPTHSQVSSGQQIQNTKAWNRVFSSILRHKSKSGQFDEKLLPIHRPLNHPHAHKQEVLKVSSAAHSRTKNISRDMKNKGALQSSQNFRTANSYFPVAAPRTRHSVEFYSHRERRSSGTGNIGNSDHESESVKGVSILSVLTSGHIRTKRSPSRSKQQKKEGSTLLPTLLPERDTSLPQFADTEEDYPKRKVKEGLSGRRREAKAHKELKAERKAKHGQGEKSHQEARTGSNDESRNKPGVHSTSPSDALSTFPASQFSTALLEDVQKVDAKGHGHSSTSSTKRQKVTKKQGKVTPTPYLGLDGKPLNLTKFMNFLKEKEFQRQVNREAQWAYLSLVTVICLMLWCLWYLGGFARCRYQPDSSVPFAENQHMLSIEEVLRRKQQYLPMFNEPEWEDVLFCNRGTNP